MKSRIEYVTGRPWHRAVGRSLRVSEYILYGTYVDQVLHSSDYGHYASTEDLCHCCWFTEDLEALVCGDDRINDNAVALLLQSNFGLEAGEEAAIADIALEQMRTV